MLDFELPPRRIDSHAREATTKSAAVVLDTDVNGRLDAFNRPSCFRRCSHMHDQGYRASGAILNFAFRGVEVKLRGVRQNKPPKMVGIPYELIVDTDESDRRFDLLHENVRKFGTISNTVAAATKLEGQIKRRPPSGSGPRPSLSLAGEDPIAKETLGRFAVCSAVSLH